MSSDIRPELSKNSDYYIDRHRFYELKHFCLQYYIWKEKFEVIDGLDKSGTYLRVIVDGGEMRDPTVFSVEKREIYLKKMRLVEDVAKEIDPVLGEYIFKGVTEGLAYPALRLRYNVPCCKDVYYKFYRRFFLLLNKRKE